MASPASCRILAARECFAIVYAAADAEVRTLLDAKRLAQVIQGAGIEEMGDHARSPLELPAQGRHHRAAHPRPFGIVLTPDDGVTPHAYHRTT